jgi:hypothetical protein
MNTKIAWAGFNAAIAYSALLAANELDNGIDIETRDAVAIAVAVGAVGEGVKNLV